jgi:hypothetical protein
LGGEALLLRFNSLVGLAALAVTVAFTLLAAPREWRALAWAAGLVAAALVATSSELLVRLVVPLADGAALALTGLAVLPVLLSLRWADRRARWHALLGGAAGLTLAAAYSVRYTQLLVAPGIALVAWLRLRNPRDRWAFLLAFAVAAGAGSVPDLLYRVGLYGTPFRFGTGELALFSPQALPTALAQLGAEALDVRELGWMWPLTLIGAAWASRRARAQLLVTLATFGPLLLFHLWYPFVRLRDVLSLYVPVAAYTSLGALALLAWLWRRAGGWATAARVAAVAGALGLGVLRLGPVLGFSAGFFTFGYLFPEQRQALESIASLTEPQAVIACSLNSGAVELYAGRETVRPGQLLQPGSSWTATQWLTMADALEAAGRPVYLLMDSPEMEAPLAVLQAHYHVAPVAQLDVPVFYVGGGSLNEHVPLYKVLGAE